MKIPTDTQKLLFVLGSQRSGTTWLANIFDASPDTLLFMEPFSKLYGLFPEFPDTSQFMDEATPDLIHLLRVEMPSRLLAHKYFLFRQSLVNPKWFGLDRWLARKARLFRLTKLGKIQDRVRLFELLNLNRMDSEYPIYPKNRDPHVWVIKELRLAGKIRVLLQAFPSAHFVVIMRHPCATVHSIQSWFRKGRLIELRDDLRTYLDDLEGQPVSTPYKKLIADCRNESDAHKLALYWRVSYETIFKQLENHPHTQFLVYEQIASKPIQSVKEIFERADLSWADSLDEYIAYSTSTELAEPGPTTTVRASEQHYKQWQKEINKETLQAVSDVTGDSFLMQFFKPYY